MTPRYGTPRPAGVPQTSLALYVMVVLVWGFSWYPVRLQTGMVPETVSVLYRIAASALLMWAWMRWRREPMKFAAKLHGRFLVLGVCLFSANYTCFYYAANFAPSGLLAVVFSLLTIVNLFNQRIFLGIPIESRQLLAALMGIGGLGVIFAPRINADTPGVDIPLAFVLCLAATFIFSAGNIQAVKNTRDNISVLAANTWGMTYGAILLAGYIFITGQPMIFDTRPVYVLSLAFLVVFGTIIAFACYVSLMRLIGAARAAYATVLFPIIALGVSSLMEGLVWNVWMVLGLLLIIAGNVLVLSGRPHQATP